MSTVTAKQATAARETAVKTILISQPAPLNAKNPYASLSDKYNVKIDFRKFIQIDPVSLKEFRRYRISPDEFSAVILTSKSAIDHFFKLCKDLRVEMPADTKYFCSSEAVALYLQKFIEYRKRKVFYSKKDGKTDLYGLLKKHKDNENFLFPCANNHKKDIPNYLEENEFDYKEVTIYNVISSDLSDLENIFYDMIVFFTPLGIKSLYDNFPDFKQNNTRLAAYGKLTSKAMENHDLIVDVSAPSPETPSMTMAIEAYLKKVAKKK